MCRSCLIDAHCLASQTCNTDFRCELTEGCAADAECPGQRICEAGVCAAVDCAGDRFDSEPGVILTTRTYNDLVLCDETTDRLPVTQGADETLRIIVRHNQSEGDLAMTIFDETAGGLEVGSSDGQAGIEYVDLPPTGGERNLTVAVSGMVGYSGGL